MRSLIIILSAVFISFNTQDDDTNNLYMMALKKHIITSQDSRKEKTTGRDTIFVMNADIVELPVQIKGHPIMPLGDSAMSFLKDKSSLHAIQINPIRVNKGNIVIPLNDYVVSQGAQGANFSFVGGKKYVISFNNSTKQYTIIQTKLTSF